MLHVKRAAVGAAFEVHWPAVQSPEKVISAKERARRQFQELMYVPRLSGHAQRTSDDTMKKDCAREFAKYIQLSIEAQVDKKSVKPPSPLAWWK